MDREKNIYIKYIMLYLMFWISKENPGCVSWIDSTLKHVAHFDAHNHSQKKWKKNTKEKKYSVQTFLEHFEN